MGCKPKPWRPTGMNKFQSTCVLVSTSVFFLLAPIKESLALPTQNSSAGIQLGATFTNSTTLLTLGVQGITKMQAPWGLGAKIDYYSQSTTLGYTSYNNSFTSVTGQGLYFFSNQLDGLRVGVEAGLGFASTSIPGASGTTTILFGPTVGYDYGVLSQVTVGAESSLLLSTAAGTSTALQLLATVRYWF